MAAAVPVDEPAVIAVAEGEQPLFRIVQECTCGLSSVTKEEYRQRLTVDASSLFHRFDREIMVEGETPLDRDIMLRIHPTDAARSIVTVKRSWARRNIDGTLLKDFEISEESILVYMILIKTRTEELLDEMWWSSRHILNRMMRNLEAGTISARDSMIGTGPVMDLTKLHHDYQAVKFMFLILLRRMRNGAREERVV